MVADTDGVDIGNSEVQDEMCAKARPNLIGLAQRLLQRTILRCVQLLQVITRSLNFYSRAWLRTLRSISIDYIKYRRQILKIEVTLDFGL